MPRNAEASKVVPFVSPANVFSTPPVPEELRGLTVFKSASCGVHRGVHALDVVAPRCADTSAAWSSPCELAMLLRRLPRDVNILLFERRSSLNGSCRTVSVRRRLVEVALR